MREVRHIILIALLLSAIVGCSKPDDDDAVDDDTVPTVAEIESTDPEDGEQGFYHRNLIRVQWDGLVSGVSVALEDADGNEIQGETNAEDVTPSESESEPWTKATFDPFGDEPDHHLAPSTSYIATIDWDDHEPVEITFATSDVGTPVDELVLVGRDYRIDMQTARFTEPPGVGNLLATYMAYMDLTVHVVSIEADELQAFVGLVEAGPGGWTQDLCEPTLAFTSPDGDPGPGLFENPYMRIGPHDLPIAIEGYEATIQDLEVGISFTMEGGAIAGGTFDGFMELVYVTGLDPDPEEGQCDLLESLGIECLECPDDPASYCLFVSAYDITGERSSVTGTNPETGEIYDTLTVVTEEMVEAWEDGGWCP